MNLVLNMTPEELHKSWTDISEAAYRGADSYDDKDYQEVTAAIREFSLAVNRANANA